jgi:hypothetical protein
MNVGSRQPIGLFELPQLAARSLSGRRRHRMGPPDPLRSFTTVRFGQPNSARHLRRCVAIFLERLPVRTYLCAASYFSSASLVLPCFTSTSPTLSADWSVRPLLILWVSLPHRRDRHAGRARRPVISLSILEIKHGINMSAMLA